MNLTTVDAAALAIDINSCIVWKMMACEATEGTESYMLARIAYFDAVIDMHTKHGIALPSLDIARTALPNMNAELEALRRTTEEV